MGSTQIKPFQPKGPKVVGRRVASPRGAAPLSEQPLAGRSCMPLRPNCPKSGAGSWPPKSTQGLIEAALRDQPLQGLLTTEPFRLQPIKPHRAACAYQDQTPISKSNPQGLVFRVERFINHPRLVLLSYLWTRRRTADKPTSRGRGPVPQGTPEDRPCFFDPKLDSGCSKTM